MWKYTGKTRPPFAESAGPGQESVWDYPRPPRIAPDHRRVQVGEPDALIADTQSAVRILETASPPTFYLPPEDIATDGLLQVPGTSYCEWKGAAVYWALANDPAQAVAWSYPQPDSSFDRLQGWLAFYPGRIPCYVNGERVRPQPGGFYGGWVTNEIVGPWKGTTGTSGW